MNSKPRVSVLIPTYNYAHFLDDAIQSVLDQTFTDFELIIVDNHSTDHTDEVVKKYLTDPRVSYYKNDRNIGLVGNWNKCLSYANGTYIKFLCADDKFFPQLLEKFVAIMDQYPGVSIVSSYNEGFGSISCCRMSPFKGLVSSHVAIENLIGKKNWLFAPTANMFRKADLKVGGFNPELKTKIDLEFYLRLLNLGDCYIIPECLSYTRVHPNTETALMNAKKHEHIFERYKLMTIVKMASASILNTPKRDHLQSIIDNELKIRATRCAAIIYEVLPKLYIRENRIKFQKALQIGYSERVLFKPLLQYFRFKYISKLIRRN